MRRPRLINPKFSNEAISRARSGGSREAVVDGAQRLFLERGFGAVTIDELPRPQVWPGGGSTTRNPVGRTEPRQLGHATDRQPSPLQVERLSVPSPAEFCLFSGDIQ